MTEVRPPLDRDDDERELAALLRRASPRVAPSDRAREAARVAVEGAWRETLAVTGTVVGVEQGRAAPSRRTRWPLALAASLVIALLGVSVVYRAEVARPAVAQIERVDGLVTLQGARWWSRESRAADGMPLVSGAVLETTNSSVALVNWGPALAVRLASDTSVQAQGDDELLLRQGRVYIDARGGASALRVTTPQGVVSHVGTQYEVAVSGREVTVAVREGAVMLEQQAEARRIEAGQQLRLDASGSAIVAPIAPADAQWQWIGALPLPIDIEGLELHTFLQWYSHETGRQVRFATPSMEAAMRGIQLHGSVDGLTVDEALRTVLASSGLEAAVAGEMVELTRAP